VARSGTVAERVLCINPPKGGQARTIPLPPYVAAALDAAHKRAPFRGCRASARARLIKELRAGSVHAIEE